MTRVVFACLLTWGCEATPARDAQQVQRVDSLGLEIVTNLGPDRPLPWTFREAFRVGGAEDGSEAFFDVPSAGIASDDAGNLYVLDAGNRRISVFDPSGQHLRSFGSEGDGPGELRSPRSLAVSPQGVISVYDSRRRAVVDFSSEGLPIPRSRSLPPVALSRIRYTRQGLVFAKGDRDADRGRTIYGLIAETPSDTVRLTQIEQRLSPPLRLESCGIGLPSMPRIFDPFMRWTTHGDVVVVSDDSSYTVRWFEAGRLIRVIRRDTPQREATEALALAELGEGMEVGLPGGVERVCSPQETLEKRGMAETVPAIASLHVGTEHLWVIRWAIGDERAAIDVFDRAGTYVGTLGDQAPVPTMILPGGRVASLETDQLGVQRIVVYEVVK